MCSSAREAIAKKRGAKDTRKTFKAKLRSEGLLDEVRIDTVTCVGLCKPVPDVVVYPKGA